MPKVPAVMQDIETLPTVATSATVSSNPMVILLLINLMLFIAGMLMDAISIYYVFLPILIPIMAFFHWDPVWFGVVMTIVMEMGLIHPPVGLNIFVIKNVAPDIPLKDVIWGVMPFVGLMFLAVFLLCAFPGIATGLPNMVMGAK